MDSCKDGSKVNTGEHDPPEPGGESRPAAEGRVCALVGSHSHVTEILAVPRGHIKAKAFL